MIGVSEGDLKSEVQHQSWDSLRIGSGAWLLQGDVVTGGAAALINDWVYGESEQPWSSRARPVTGRRAQFHALSYGSDGPAFSAGKREQ